MVVPPSDHPRRRPDQNSGPLSFGGEVSPPTPQDVASATSRKAGFSSRLESSREGGREVLLVYKKSQLRLAVENKNSRITGLLEKGDASVAAMQAAAIAHDHSIGVVDAALKAAGCVTHRVYRARLRPEDIRGRLVVTVGGDGTVLDTSHRIADDTAILGVNSDPERSTGFLCACDASDFHVVLAAVLAGRLQPTPLARLGGDVDGRPLPVAALNDVLVGHKSPASTSRYVVERSTRPGRLGHTEEHKSSGVYIGTAAGSTAAICSAGGVVQDLDDVRMQWQVRELLTLPPAAGIPRAFSFDRFFFGSGDDVVVTSRMREGRLWIDGPHVCVDLPLGARLTLHGRAPPLHLYVSETMRRRRADLQRSLPPRST